MNTQSEPARIAPGRSIGILLVDDQAFIGMAVTRILATEADMTVHCCQKASDAIDQANQLAPTLILQDLQMPDIDGLTLVGRFRSNPATATTPIIVLSGNDDEESRAGAVAAGANDYLVKLPRKDSLVACIRRHAARPFSDTTEAIPATTVIDRFLADATSLGETLNQAAGPWDVVALKAAAQRLKAASLTVGAQRLSALCAQLEEKADRQLGGMVRTLLIRGLNEELVNARSACLLERDAGTPSADRQTASSR